MKTRALNVWMNGQLVGTWSWSKTDVHSFEYADAWVGSSSARALSLSLPIPAGEKVVRGIAVKNYFDNLLPDSSQIRERLRSRLQLGSVNITDLLRAIGRDCVGAVQLLPDGELPTGFDQIQGKALTEDDVEQHLLSITNDSVYDLDAKSFDDFRISIAGAQEKTALLKYQGQWLRPQGATPTTHIFKLALGLVGNMRADMSASIENEWLCSRIMKALGFEVAPTEIAQFGKQKF